MKKTIWNKLISCVAVLTMILGLLPTTALAAHDSTGKPTDLKNPVYLAIYNKDGFPGEPAVYGITDYTNFKKDFKKGNWTTFAARAEEVLKPEILNVLVQGTPSNNAKVWGIYDDQGTKEYFKAGSSLLKEENELKIVQAIKGNNATLDQYEIIWYVIKYQTDTYWHIDGVIKEKAKYAVHYYGNGNTAGQAPTGVTNITPGGSYTVLGNTGELVKELNGVNCEFLGWNTKADGSGTWYQASDKITNINENVALYAQWKTTVSYTATVNTYLDYKRVNASEIHGEAMDLFLSTDGGKTVIKLDRTADGTYTAEVENGNYRLYHLHGGETEYEPVGNFQLTIYNQNGSLDMNHYTVTYNADGGVWAAGEQPETEAYPAMNPVTAITQTPTKDGYLFTGWKDQNGNEVQPGGVVTSTIANPIVLTAQWEKTVDVTINVTINHDAKGGGHDVDVTKDELTVALVARPDAGSAYLETGHVVNFNNDGVTGYDYYADGDKYTAGSKPADEEAVEKTEYKATAPMATGVSGAAQYTVVTSKSHYEVLSITESQDADGNWTIDVVLEFDPVNFDLDFTVGVEEDIPEQYIPDAAIVKVAYWNEAENQWKIITQHDGDEPGVRVDIDAATRQGSGSHPVWMTDSENDPYGYRIVVTAFVYPNGTIVAVDDVSVATTYTDGNYTATVADVTGGKRFGNGLDGAYYNAAASDQAGKLHAQIDMELYDVTFDAMGGKVNGKDAQTVEELLAIPGFDGYVPTREGDYVFEGWYKDKAGTIPAVENEWLTADVTLYAKWSHLLTIQGTVTIDGLYDGGAQVNEEDRPTEALVVLQRYDSTGVAQDVTSQIISFDSYTAQGSADYSFTGIRDEGRTYRILVMELNYTTTYDNESDADAVFTDGEHDAVYGDDFVAVINANLNFEPEAAPLIMNVDAKAIGDGFRPTDVLAEVLYRDTGTTNIYKRIAQHNVPGYGVEIDLSGVGLGEGSEIVWKYHYDAAPYGYQMNVSKVDSVDYNSDTSPFDITYDPAVRWDSVNGQYTGELKATLTPKTYKVIFDLRVEDGERVEQMNTKQMVDPETDEITYYVDHTWSYDTAINVRPTRDGYLFEGWVAETSGAYADGVIDAAVSEDVVLVAQWRATGIEYYNNYAYIFGYNDTTMAPEEALLRSEVCAMIHRLAKQAGSLNGFVYDEAKEPAYVDIAGQWHRSGIEFLHYMGGFAEAKNIYPDVAVTRGEAFKLVCIGLSFTDDTTLTNDEYAEILYNAGFISGDGTGDLMVDSTFKRAEFCSIYNTIIGRASAGLETRDGTKVTPDTYGYTDIPAGAWYYQTMVRATSAYDKDGYIDLTLRGVRNDLDDYNG